MLDNLLAQHRVLWRPRIKHDGTHAGSVPQVNENSDYSPYSLLVAASPFSSMEWNRIVGTNVRRLRVERKLTQEQLAHDAQIDLTYEGGIERGRRNPSVSVLGRLAAALGVHPRELFEEQ